MTNPNKTPVCLPEIIFKTHVKIELKDGYIVISAVTSNESKNKDNTFAANAITALSAAAFISVRKLHTMILRQVLRTAR